MANAFNLLQMYQDDDDDDDMEESAPIETHQPDDVEERESEQSRNEMTSVEVGETDNKIEELNLDDVVTMTNSRPPTPQVAITARREKPAIVDYAHDDVAMSPEHEEGEFFGRSMGQVTYSDELVIVQEVQQRTLIVNVQSTMANNTVDSSQLPAESDVPQPDMINSAVKDSDTEVQEVVEVCDEDSRDVDPLDKFLPPPPQEQCSDELQEKIDKFLEYKLKGKSFNVAVRNKKDYRNPDFLRHAVRYQDIDEIGSCFSKDVFDPHGYDESDFYDAIEAAITRERERKEQERKRSPKVEFVSGATQAATVGVTPKIMLPSPGVSILPSGGSQPGSADSLPREGRLNKKSKWDKVDGDRRSLMDGHKTLPSVGAHALSAANAGAGYAVYAQQKRREAEERRSSDRKGEKRT